MKGINYGFIYLFTVSGKGYVGQTPYLKKRFKRHFKVEKINPYFHNSLRKHFLDPKSSFKILECWKRNGRTLEEFKKLLGNREIFWIAELDTYDPEQKKGWNLTKGGSGCLGAKINQGEKNPQFGKVGFWKGKVFSEEHRKKLSKIREGKSPWNKGISWSEEQKIILSKTHKGQIPWNLGIPQTEEHRIKNSESHKGQVAWNKGLKLKEVMK